MVKEDQCLDTIVVRRIDFQTDDVPYGLAGDLDRDYVVRGFRG